MPFKSEIRLNLTVLLMQCCEWQSPALRCLVRSIVGGKFKFVLALFLGISLSGCNSKTDLTTCIETSIVKSTTNKWSQTQLQTTVNSCTSGAGLAKESDCHKRNQIITYCNCYYNAVGEHFTFTTYQSNPANAENFVDGLGKDTACATKAGL